MKVIVYHGEYDCDTGCCGHYVSLDPKDAESTYARCHFVFDHRDRKETPIEFAKRLITEEFGTDHVSDLDWENCVIMGFGECP